jgi:hypothetical protein
MADAKTLPLVYRLPRPPEFRGREERRPEPDQGKLPLLPDHVRFELKPPRNPWRRMTLRQRLARSR